MRTIIIKYKYEILISAFLLLVMFIISPDSYTHHLFIRDDSAIFFTSGKALMCGMIPYVDFADSKGPLLWLIYGIGYLISHYDYTGVFWLSWIAYSITFTFIYRTSYIFLESNKLSLIVSIAMIMFVFYPWFHYEIKSEDWCQPFVAATIFYACRVIYSDQVKKHDVRKAFVVFGISFSACLLIKFNIAAMLSSVYLYLAYHEFRQHKNILFLTLWSAVSAVGIAIPFVVYLISVGAFDAFINEYFVHTLMTIDNSQYHTSYIHELLYHMGRSERILYFIASLAGGCGIWFIKRRAAMFPPLILCIFWALSSRHADSHYFNACTILSIFVVICIVYTYRNHIINNFRIFALLATTFTFIFTIMTNSFKRGYLNSSFEMIDSPYSNDMKHVYLITSKIENPKMIFYRSLDRGDGIKAGALPGSIYWTSQKGASKAMEQKQIEDIKAHKADFIITEALDYESLNRNIADLQNYGYKVAYRFKAEVLKRALLSKSMNNVSRK